MALRNHTFTAGYYQSDIYVTASEVDICLNENRCKNPGLDVLATSYLKDLLGFQANYRQFDGVENTFSIGHFGYSLPNALNTSEIDFTVNGPFYTLDRWEFARFMMPTGFEKLAALVRKPTSEYMSDYTKIVDANVWMTILIMCVVTTALSFVSTTFLSKPGRQSANPLQILVDCFTALLQKPFIEKDEKVTFIMICWRCGANFLSLLYVALIYSAIIFKPKPKFPFTDSQSLMKEVERGNYGLLIQLEYRNLTKPYLCRSTACRNNIAFVEDDADAEKLFQQNFMREINGKLPRNLAYIDDMSYLKDVAHRYCYVAVVELEDFSGMYYSTMFSRDFPYSEQFNRQSERVRKYMDFELNRLMAKQTVTKWCRSMAEETVTEPLRVRHVEQAFICLGIGALFSIAVLIVEILSMAYKGKFTQLNDKR